MLVLTRNVGEEIVIDGCIRVVVSRVSGHKVRLAVSAPEPVRVDRGEVHQRRTAFASQGHADEDPGGAAAGEVARAATHALRCSGHPPLWGLDCAAEDGRLVVRGQVPTYYLKQLVQQIIMNQGAPHVDNLVEVGGAASSPVVR